MTDSILRIIGILISVSLFLIGYRKTIGAKKERIAAANANLEKILLRRIVLEKWTPILLDLSRLIEGKARDYRVRSTELLSETQLLNMIYTRVLESDLIFTEQREEIIKRITPVLTTSESAPVKEEVFEEVLSSKKINWVAQVTIILMAIIASILGGIISVIPDIKNLPDKLTNIIPTSLSILPTLSITITISLGIIAIWYTISRWKNLQEEQPSKDSQVTGYIEFENDVRKILENSNLSIHPDTVDQGYDYLVEKGGKKILLELKSWPKPLPDQIIRDAMNRLNDASKRVGATESIIVTKNKNPMHDIIKELMSHVGIKFMTLKELRNYLMHNQ
jgi:hypothetical protein